MACLVSLAMPAILNKASAQAPVQLPVRAGDTLVNADTLTRYYNFSDGYAGVILTPSVTKISGTVAGTVYLYESPDGVHYGTTPLDSLVLSNTSGAQFPNRGWRLSAPIAPQYKVVFITAATQSYYTRFIYVARRYAQNTGGN